MLIVAYMGNGVVNSHISSSFWSKSNDNSRAWCLFPKTLLACHETIKWKAKCNYFSAEVL